VRAVIALGAGLLVLAALSAAPATPSAAKCRATLVFRGVTYYGLEASHLAIRRGPAIGTALEPECNDTPPPCRPGDNCSPPKPIFRRVAVRRIAGVRPRMAIARRDVPNVIYVAADRCRGNLAAAALVRCLKQSR
jgi:uncharacterized protein DUF6281